MGQGSEEINPIRRRLVFGGLAAAGAAAIPGGALAKALEGSVGSREEHIRTTVELARKQLKTPELMRALKGQGEAPLARVLNAVGAPIMRKQVEGTAFDVAELHRRYPVQLAGSPNGRRLVAAYDGAGLEAYRSSPRANCFYFGDADHVMANAHTILGSKELRQGRSVDAGLLRVPRHFRASSEEQIIRDDGTVTNADIQASLVAVVGIDPGDRTSDKEGHKTFLGVAFRLEPGFIQAIRRTGQPWADHLSHSFAIVLPPGENDDSAEGMSGSQVSVYKDGEWKFCGEYWGSKSTGIQNQGRTMTLGYLHGIDDLRAERERPDFLRANF